MTVLAIGSHPDDIEIGCGGTLLKLRERDVSVHMLVLTPGSTPQDRMSEQKEAAEIIGATYTVGGLPDTCVEVRTAIALIENTIRDNAITHVFTHSPKDTHQDHCAVADATVAACRNRGNVLFYESYSSIHFNPLIFVDIEAQLAKKTAAVKAHQSQFDPQHIQSYVHSCAAFRAHRLPFSAVEGFVPWNLMWNLL